MKVKFFTGSHLSEIETEINNYIEKHNVLSADIELTETLGTDDITGSWTVCLLIRA